MKLAFIGDNDLPSVEADSAFAKEHGFEGLEYNYVHIKEHPYKDGKLVSQPAAGMGDIEWGKVFAFLHEHRYTGWLSMEPHGPIWGHGEMRRKMLLLSKRYVSQFIV